MSSTAIAGRYSSEGLSYRELATPALAPIRKLILIVPDQPKVVLVPGQSVVVGRTSEADVPVTTDRMMSRRHFSIICSQREATLCDLDSTNGTAVNGQRVHTVSLRHADQISAGLTRFVVLIR